MSAWRAWFGYILLLFRQSNMCLIPTALSLLHPIHISLLARLKNPSDRQFLAIQLFDQPGIPHVLTIVASALWPRFSDPCPHGDN